MPIRYSPVLLSICILFFTVQMTGASSIDDFLSLSFHTYVDDTHQRILSTKAARTKRISDKWGYGVSLGVDAISGATPSTSGEGGGGGGDDDEDEGENETGARVYPSLSLKYDDGTNIASAGGYLSFEEDYAGQSLFADYTRLLNLGNTALGISITDASDKWKVDGIDPDNRDERSVALSLTQTLTQGSQARLVWTNIRSKGYLASPYRHIDIGPDRILERLPDARDGDALAVKMVTLLSEKNSLHLGYRYYRDDWSISSHTIDTALYRDTSPNWTWGGRFRYYTQNEADFVRPVQDIQATDEFIAIDYRNSAYNTYTAGMEFLYDPDGGQGWLLDWSNAALKGGVDLYTTSSNDFIDHWFGQNSITGLLITVSLEYNY